MSRSLAGSLLLLGLAAQAAGAQTVTLRIREDSSRVDLPGAIVRLLRGDTAVAQALTDEVGRVTLHAPGPGSYRIRIDRIGWSGHLTGPIRLAAGETLRTEILMRSERITLPTVVVSGTTLCGAQTDETSPAITLWEEVRKALTANVLSQQRRRIPLHVRLFERDVSRTGNPGPYRVTKASIVRGQPFRSLPPALLAERGFVQFSRDEMTFGAPDAALLLSDEFVTTHCFNAAPGTGGLVGLAFAPVPRRRVPDVRGTLWVDHHSSELRFLEYSYTGLRPELGGTSLGGRIEFTRLDTGDWIVSYWHIRMPRMEVRSMASRAAMLTGFIDQGGRAEVAYGTAGAAQAVVSGRVYDSIAGSGLERAVIRVAGVADSVFSDAEGRFMIAVPKSGSSVLTAWHPRLGLLPGGSIRDVILSLGDTTQVEFWVPSLDAFVEAFCGARQGRSGIIGLAWGPGMSPAEGLTVRVMWEPGAGSVRDERSESGPRGVFAVCDLPAGRTLPVRLLDRVRPLSELTLRLEPGEFRWVELRPPPGA